MQEGSTLYAISNWHVGNMILTNYYQLTNENYPIEYSFIVFGSVLI